MSREEIKLNPPIRLDINRRAPGGYQDVAVFDFEPLWDRRHVFKHVLDLTQQWSTYYGSVNLATLRTRLVQLSCKGYRGEGQHTEDMHGPSCPNFAQCDTVLGNLYPTYRTLIVEAIREGAYENAPRHTHNRENTNYFLSNKGILAETYENTQKNRIEFKTAYRRPPRGRKPPGRQWQDSHFVRAAREEICLVRERLELVRRYCTKQRWCGI
jgi:hypothetical protein